MDWDGGLWNARTVLCQFALLYAVQFHYMQCFFIRCGTPLIICAIYYVIYCAFVVICSTFVVICCGVVLMSLYVVIFPLYLHFVILLAVFCHYIG